MSISLIKKEFKSNSQENQKELQKAMFAKNNFIVNITDYENDSNFNDNCIKTGIAYVYLTYSKNYYGFKFLKATLKKLLKLDNISFKDFTKQDIQDYLELSTQDILKDLSF